MVAQWDLWYGGLELMRRTQVLRVALGTLSLFLAFAVAFFGFALSQGERDILSSFLTVAGVSAVAAFALYGWSAVAWYQLTKVSAAIGGTAATEPVPGAVSTVLLVVGVVLVFVGLPMLIDGVHRLTGSGAYSSAYGQQLRSSGYAAAEWPWLLAVGLALTATALVWKVRLRRARRSSASSA